MTVYTFEADDAERSNAHIKEYACTECGTALAVAKEFVKRYSVGISIYYTEYDKNGRELNTTHYRDIN